MPSQLVMINSTPNEPTVCTWIPADAKSARPAVANKTAPFGIAVHPLLRDFLLTAATEFSILIAGLVLVSLFGRLLGPTALGEFLLLRRITSWLAVGTLLGMGSAIPRYVAFSLNRPEAGHKSFFVAGCLWLLVCTASLELLFYLDRYRLAHWMFGSVQLSYLMLPLGLLFGGSAIQTAAFGYYRGVLELRRANAIQLFHFAIIPLAAIALLYRRQSLALILNVTGALTMLSAALFALPVFLSLRQNQLRHIKPYARELLRYGVGRVPGQFGTGAFLSLGPLVATHYVSMIKVGYLLLGVNFLTVMGYTTEPVGVLLLSKLSAMLGRDRMADARSSLPYLMRALMDTSVFAALQLVVFADLLIRAWVGARFLEALNVTRILLLAVPPYLFFMVLRCCIDAATPKARNTQNVLISLACFGVFMTATVSVLPQQFLLVGLATSLVIALLVLSILTARTFKQLYDLPVPLRHCAVSFSVGILLALLSYGFRQVGGFGSSYWLAAIFELVMVGVFVGVLVSLRSSWLSFLWCMAFPGSNLAATVPEEPLV